MCMYIHVYIYIVYMCVYDISTRGGKPSAGQFSRLFFITFSDREGEGFSISWKKIEIILAVKLFSADEMFRNR